jgi:VanZ family protein
VSFARRHLPAVLFAAAVLSMSGPWASMGSTGRFVEPLFEGLGFSAAVSAVLHALMRKAGHLAAYAVFGALALRSTRGDAPATRRSVLGALGLASLLAGADESLQSLTPDRGGCLSDVLFDVAGAALGLALLLAWSRRRSRPAASLPEPDPAS